MQPGCRLFILLHSSTAYFFICVLPIGVPAGRGYNLLLIGVTGATAAPCPRRWLRREGRRRRALCVGRRHEGGAKAPGALLFARSAAEGKIISEGRRGHSRWRTEWRKPPGCHRLAFVRGLADGEAAGVQGCEAPAKTLTGTVGRVSVRWLPGVGFCGVGAATARHYTCR